MRSVSWRMLLGLLLASFMFAPAPPAWAADASPPAKSAELHALFDARWEALMAAYPPWATYVGDHRYGDRLVDASPPAIADRYDAMRSALKQAQAVDRSALSRLDRASLDGFQSEFASLLQASPVDTPAQA